MGRQGLSFPPKTNAVDALTHGLASYALTRALFPRASRITATGVVLAGTVADLDGLSVKFGPSTFLIWHRTFLHSLAGALVIAILFSLAVIFVQRNIATKDPLNLILAATLGASLLHVGLDLCQNDGLEALWPFRTGRYSANWLAHFDLWILLILLAGALFPQLLALVTEEIGAKSKAPRGRVGALLALLGIGLYLGARAILHSNAVALLDSRTYSGEMPRRIAALAESDSPFHWRGIVETERSLRELDLDLGPRTRFNPDAGIISFKPEASPPLEAAQNTEIASQFLRIAKFPKATVEKTNTGFRVEIRDLAYPRDAHSGMRVSAVMDLDPNARVLDQQLIWDRASREP